MTQDKWTPGPWALGDTEEYDIIIGNPGESDCILEGYLVGSDPERRHANAVLMTAAPELLDVLLELFERENNIVTMFGGNPGAVEALEQRARAAIAKATGQ